MDHYHFDYVYSIGRPEYFICILEVFLMGEKKKEKLYFFLLN